MSGPKKKRPEGIPDLTPENRRGGIRDFNPFNHVETETRSLVTRAIGKKNHRDKALEWYHSHGCPATVMHEGEEIPFPPALLTLMFPPEKGMRPVR